MEGFLMLKSKKDSNITALPNGFIRAWISKKQSENKPVGMFDKQLLRTFKTASATTAGVTVPSHDMKSNQWIIKQNLRS